MCIRDSADFVDEDNNEPESNGAQTDKFAGLTGKAKNKARYRAKVKARNKAAKAAKNGAQE